MHSNVFKKSCIVIVYRTICCVLSRCRTPGGTRPLRGPAAVATRIVIVSETEGENLGIAAHRHFPPAVNVRGEGEDTDRMPAMPDRGGMIVTCTGSIDLNGQIAWVTGA